MKRIFLAGGALAAVLVTMPMFAAFEAHVVNVTATIENALTVPVKFLEYGTVFPQEKLDQFLDVRLSQSFDAQSRLDDVTYHIRQKPKCAITSNNGQSYDNTVVNGEHIYTGTGEVVVTLGDNPATTPDVETNFPNVTIDCGPTPRPLVTGETWGVLPSLCPYLSKHEMTTDSPENDTNLNAFHEPFFVQNGTTTIDWNEAFGKLIQSAGDLADQWKIDLRVPCFSGSCAQDWPNFIRTESGNPQIDVEKYKANPLDEHKVFGCDLWFEVNGFSLPPTTEPETATVTVDKVVQFTSTFVVGVDVNDFQLTIDGPGALQVVADEVATAGLPVGTYSISEVYSNDPSGISFNASFTGGCSEVGDTGVGTMNVVAGVNPTCVITNLVVSQ